ncbi:MFS transporter [Clostridium perfringens]|nr:MFS transporter [Clostridium perfringens]
MRNRLDRNKFFYKCYTISSQSLFIWTIFLIYLRGKGLSFTEVMVLNSLSAVITFVFEVPSGILADKLNRKSLLVLGEVLRCLSLCIILFTNNYCILLFSSVFSGLAESMISGSGIALIYDSFLEEKKEEEYKQYLANTQMWALRFSAFATLVSGVLYKFNFNLPMILSIILEIFSIVFLLRLKDTKVINFSNININLKEIFVEERNNIIGLRNNKYVLKLFFIYFVMMILISNLNYTSQAYLTDIGISYSYIGIIFFIFSIISSFGAKSSAKVKFRSRVIIFWYCLVLIGLYFSGIYISLILLAIARFMSGMIWPILSDETNKVIDSNNRATILSYRSLISQISFIIFDPLVGLLLDKLGFKFTYVIMGTCTLGILSLVLLFKILKNKTKINYTNINE